MGIVFGHPPATVGAAWKVEVSAVSRSADAASGEQLSTYESDVRVDVLAVDGPAPSRVRLRFERNVHTYQEKATPTVIHGKTYVVDAKPPHVRDLNDAPVSEEESQRVLDVFPDLGTRARIDEVMPDDPMKVGDRHDELAAAVLRVLHPRAWSMNRGTATLARAEDGHGVFSIVLDASSTSGLRMQVSGEVRVRLRDARLSEVSLDGSYRDPKAPADAEPSTFRVRRSVRDAR